MIFLQRFQIKTKKKQNFFSLSRGVGVGGGGARVSILFTKNPNLKSFFLEWGVGRGGEFSEFCYYESKFNFFFFLGGGGEGRRARESVFFLHTVQIKKKIGGEGVRGKGGRVDGRTDEQAQTNLPL